MIENLNWITYFFEICKTVSIKSKDPSTKVGCVIVGPAQEIRTTGYNGFPRGVNDTIDIRFERPLKYKWTEHAEKNAILSAARVGIPLENCVMYSQWYPCHECARAIIQVGIVAVYVDQSFFAVRAARDNQWDESFAIAKEMFEEAGISVYVV